MRRPISRSILLAIALFVVLYLIYQRLRIVIFVNVSPIQALLGIGVIVLLLFLVLDHLINRNRS